MVILYFSFTTLSTTGFGDLRPISDYERLIGAFMMLFGVATFSHVLAQYIEILEKFKKIDADIGDADKLSTFFEALKYFNKGKYIKQSMKEEIEEYFTQRW